MSVANFMARVRVDEELWADAMARATEEGTTASALVRAWLAGYVETGSPVATGKRAPVRLTAAEQKAACEAFVAAAPVLLQRQLAAINAERD